MQAEKGKSQGSRGRGSFIPSPLLAAADLEMKGEMSYPRITPGREKEGVDVFYGPTHERARSRGARRGSLQHFLHGAVRPVRPVAVQNDDDSTNARPGGTPSGQARVGLT